MNHKNFNWLIGNGYWQANPIQVPNAAPPATPPVIPPAHSPTQPTAPLVKTFTQEDVDALIGKIRGEGKKKGADETVTTLLATLKEKGLDFGSLDELVEHATSAPKKAQTAEQKLAELQKQLAEKDETLGQLEETLFFDDMQEATAQVCGELNVLESEYATVWAVLQNDEPEFLALVEAFDEEKGFVGLKEKITTLVKDHPQWQATRQTLNRLGTPRPGGLGVVPLGSGQLPPVDKHPIRAQL